MSLVPEPRSSADSEDERQENCNGDSHRYFSIKNYKKRSQPGHFYSDKYKKLANTERKEGCWGCWLWAGAFEVCVTVVGGLPRLANKLKTNQWRGVAKALGHSLPNCNPRFRGTAGYGKVLDLLRDHSLMRIVLGCSLSRKVCLALS